ncbi:egg-laying defective protein 27-like isoform X2 [Haliotis rufescens]|uniref:egg-laying defective protein 27-like isoform X2 n=1 Tax=Haliotis rufescens TaxID=6454 RepID=UPI00201F6442|nr:egg-laying defective protein 27-like isoform X2 [Haliotis rufescens]
MEDKVYTVQENIDYFERIRGERHNCDIEGFALEHAESMTASRNLMRERRASGSGRSGTDGAAQPADSYPGVMEKRDRDELVSVDDDSADVDGAHNKAVPGGDESLDEVDKMQPVTNFVNDVHVTGATGGDDSVNEEDHMQHVTNVVNDVHITGVTGGDDSVDKEDSMKQVTGISSDEDVDSSDVGVEHISGVTGGDVDNSTVVGVVKGGMRNKQTLIDSDICITGGRSQPDGDDTDADDKLKEVTGVAGGAVKDATVVGEVHGGMENEQTIENSKIYSDGGFGGSLQFLDLNIRQRDNSGEQQDGAVQIIKDCIIDLRKPDDPIDKDNKGDDADCYKDEAGSVAGNPVKEPDEETENQEMQKKIQEVKEQSEREEETRRLIEEKQADMEEQETRRLIEEKQADMEEQETRRLMQEKQAAMEEQETRRLMEEKQADMEEQETRRRMQERQADMEEQETRRLMQERQADMEEQETRRLMQERQADMEEQETRRLMEEKQAAMEEQETRRLMEEKQADMEEQETRRRMQERQADMEEQETRRLMQERQAAMEEQLQREQREREQMQFEVQRIGNEQRQNAAYRGQPNQVVVNPHMAAGGMVVVPAAPRLVYVNPNPQPARRGNGLMENIQQFFNGL